MKNLFLILILLLAHFAFAIDQKVSVLPSLNQSSWATGDLLYIVDISAGASGSKKTTIGDFDLRYPNMGNFTQGSVIFAGTSGAFTQDNTNFFWNNASKYLRVPSLVAADNSLSVEVSARALRDGGEQPIANWENNEHPGFAFFQNAGIQGLNEAAFFTNTPHDSALSNTRIGSYEGRFSNSIAASMSIRTSNYSYLAPDGGFEWRTRSWLGLSAKMMLSPEGQLGVGFTDFPGIDAQVHIAANAVTVPDVEDLQGTEFEGTGYSGADTHTYYAYFFRVIDGERVYSANPFELVFEAPGDADPYDIQVTANIQSLLIDSVDGMRVQKTTPNGNEWRDILAPIHVDPVSFIDDNTGWTAGVADVTPTSLPRKSMIAEGVVKAPEFIAKSLGESGAYSALTIDRTTDSSGAGIRFINDGGSDEDWSLYMDGNSLSFVTDANLNPTSNQFLTLDRDTGDVLHTGGGGVHSQFFSSNEYRSPTEDVSLGKDNQVLDAFSSGYIELTTNPTSGDSITINDGSTDVEFGFGTGGDITVTIGGTAAITTANLKTAIEGSALDISVYDDIGDTSGQLILFINDPSVGDFSIQTDFTALQNVGGMVHGAVFNDGEILNGTMLNVVVGNGLKPMYDNTLIGRNISARRGSIVIGKDITNTTDETIEIGTSDSTKIQVLSTGELKAKAAYVDQGALSFNEAASTPANPADGAEARIYMKADKLVIQYNDGGTVRYKYLDLTGTGVTWTHSTTPP